MSTTGFNGIAPSPQEPERLQLLEAISTLAEQMASIQADLCAYQHLAHALYATHQNRDAVKSQYLDSMDRVADASPVQMAELFRESMQKVLRELN